MPEDDTDDWPDEYDLASDAVKNCAESVQADNPDMDKSRAFEICQSMENQGQLTDPDDDADREATDTQPLFRGLADDDAHPMDPPGPIRRLEEDDGAVRFKNVMVLAPGEWTDAATKEPTYYSEQLTEHFAEEQRNAIPEREGRLQNIIDLDHEKQEVLKEVGHFDPESLQTDSHHNLYADLVFWNDTQASQDAVALFERALKSDGKQGAGGLSVEIPFEGEVTKFDPDRGMTKLIEGDLAGLALAVGAASKPVATGNQFENREVALSSPDTGIEHAYANTKSAPRPDSDMSASDGGDDREEYELQTDDGAQITVKADSVSDIQDALDQAGVEAELVNDDADDAQREAQDDGDMDMVQDLIERAESEGFDTATESAAALAEFIQAELDAGEEELAAFEDVADAYLQAVEAESLDATPAEGMLDWIREQGGAEEDGGDEEPGEEMADELAGVKEENRELRAELDDLENRLEQIEDQPDRSGIGATDDDEEPAVVGDVLGGFGEDGDYYSR